MAERPEEKRFSSPIVPDVDASLTAQHLRHSSPRARLWPLWCLVLLMVAVIGVMAYWAWEERLTMQRELNRLEGQLSNVHARLDGFGGVQEGELDEITEQVTALSSAQQAMRDRLEEQEELLDSVRVASVDEQTFASLAERIDVLEEEVDSLDAVLAAVRVSLNSLEQAGDDGRAALAAHIGVLDDQLSRHDERWEEVASQHEQFTENLAELRSQQQRLESQLEEVPPVDELQALEGDLQALAASIDALAAQREADEERLEAMLGRLSSTQAELTEIRQTQLANSAQLEVLQSQLEN